MVSISNKLTNEERDERGYEGVVDETEKKRGRASYGVYTGRAARKGRTKTRGGKANNKRYGQGLRLDEGCPPGRLTAECCAERRGVWMGGDWVKQGL